MRHVYLRAAALVLFAKCSTSFLAPAPRIISSHSFLKAVDPRREEDPRSLAEKMLGDLFSFTKPEPEKKVVTEAGPLDAGKAISDIDKRAASGELTYQDFVAMSRTFTELGGNVPGIPSKLSAADIAETKKKVCLRAPIMISLSSRSF